jgi:hypothetical protein
MPHGGRALVCPGRSLAKQEMIGGIAIFESYVKMRVSKGCPMLDGNFFGLGAQPPREPVPVLLRRKVGITPQEDPSGQAMVLIWQGAVLGTVLEAF